jgi:hypothetical protein
VGEGVVEGPLVSDMGEGEIRSTSGSLREGLDDLFTVSRLGVPDRLARSRSCTHSCYLSVIPASLRRACLGPKRWKAA